MPERPRCPQCGTPLQPGALAGLCPACLLRQGATEDSATEGGARPFAPPPPTELAPLFPQLEIIELIGKGGMGAVYKARQKQLGRTVALKILPPGISDAPAFAERFAREARALAQLNHPGIVTLYEFGHVEQASSLSDRVRAETGRMPVPQPDGPTPETGKRLGPLYYFLMEFVDGVNLRQLLHAGRVAPREALAIVPQICDALQFAHDQGIVHRDIKPENILLDRRGRVKVADFGLAKIVGSEAPLTPPLSPSDGGRVTQPGEGMSALTDADKVMGTPSYMAPEQAERPADVDHRADIYALGVVFYQMLTGELPGKPLQPPSTKVQVDVRLDEVVLRALEQQPELRYQQASVLKTQVETIASGLAPLAARSPGFPSEPGAVHPALKGVDFRSAATLFGWPLVHVASGLDPQTGRPRVARGIIAIGDRARGVVAIGGMATGGLAIGGLAVGVFAVGGAALGLVSLGGLAVALLLAVGGGAIAPIAIGGGAVGYLAFGGAGFGAHVYDSLTKDPVAERFFLPWVQMLLTKNHWLTLGLLGLVLPIAVGVPLWLQRRALRQPRAANQDPLPTIDFWRVLETADYGEAWDLAAASFQRRLSRDRWISQMDRIRRPLGKAVSRRVLSTVFLTPQTCFEQRVLTTFDGGKSAVETVVCAVQAGGVWKVERYDLRPSDEASSTASQPHGSEIRIPVRLWRKACLVVIGLTAVAGFLVWLAAPKPRVSILTGRVTDSVTGAALPQATIELSRPDETRILRRAWSDTDGEYRLEWGDGADLLYWRDGVRHSVDLVFMASAPGYERRSVFLSQIPPTGPYERAFDFRLEPASQTGAGSSNRETERVINDLGLRLRQQGFQFDGLSTSVSGDPPRLVVRFRELREARPRAGTNLWSSATGSLIADRQANGTWRVRGQQDLGRVRYTLDPISAAWEQGALPEPLPGRGPAEVADFSNQRLDEDAVRAALAGKPGLKRLDLHDSSVSDEFLAHLAGLTNLEHLDLSSTLAATPWKPRITDAGLRHLAPTSRLRVLLLHGLSITDAGLVHLQSLPRLERLQLGATRVASGEGLRGLKHLKWLRLDATPITDEALRHVGTLADLEQLYLDGTSVSDAGLPHLVGLLKLRVLNLHGTKVTADGVAALRLALPLVAVGTDPLVTADAGAATITPVTGDGEATSTAPVPAVEEALRIQFAEVSLTHAIRVLAGQLRLNYVIDPEVVTEQERAPKITVDWKDVTVRQALTALLESRNLELVPNPQTGVARIARKSALASPAERPSVAPPAVASPPAGGPDGPAVKTIVLARATNQVVGTAGEVRTVTVWTDSTVQPGEALSAWVTDSAGEVRKANTSAFTHWQPDRIHTSVCLSWFFGGPLGPGFGAEEAGAALAQLQAGLIERPLTLTVERPLTLFSVTNRSGGVMAGSIQFHRAVPSTAESLPPGGGPQAIVHVRHFSAAAPSLDYSAKVPAGYALRATANAGSVSTHTPAGPFEFHSSWMISAGAPPAGLEVAKLGELTKRHSTLEAQLQELQAQGPIPVDLGQPKRLFVVTNNVGELYEGFFELVGPSPERIR